MQAIFAVASQFCTVSTFVPAQFWWILCCLTLMALPLVIWDFYRKGYNIKYQVGRAFLLPFS